MRVFVSELTQRPLSKNKNRLTTGKRVREGECEWRVRRGRVQRKSSQVVSYASREWSCVAEEVEVVKGMCVLYFGWCSRRGKRTGRRSELALDGCARLGAADARQTVTSWSAWPACKSARWSVHRMQRLGGPRGSHQLTPLRARYWRGAASPA
jgi:hypothetical protein